MPALISPKDEPIRYTDMTTRHEHPPSASEVNTLTYYAPAEAIIGYIS